MQYLMIQNPGEAPIEGYTTLGVSTTRYDRTDRTIGQFGSGNKQAINLLLRKSISPIIFCGHTRLEFYTEVQNVNDGLISRDFHRVNCRVKGKLDDKNVNRNIDCGFTTEYGVQDWSDISMALREFISNAIDRTERQEKHFAEALKNGRLAVKVVDETQVRAKAGYTRVFVPYSEEVIQYHAQLGKRFLHFSEPENLEKRLLTKQNRNLGDRKVAVIYRNGVFVREIEDSNEESVFDYNFVNDELQIDESRNVNDWQVKSAAARLLRNAAAESIALVFRELIDQKTIWEKGFDPDYLSCAYVHSEEAKTKIRQNWNKAWEMAAGDGVLCDNLEFVKEFVEKKGFRPITIGHNAGNWMRAAEKNGVRSSISILSENEAAGRVDVETTIWAQKAVDTVWSWLEAKELVFNKEKPVVGCFRDIMRAGSSLRGYYQPRLALHDGTILKESKIFINEAEASDGLNKELLHTALEEVVHHITGAGDMSRDFQNYLLQAIVDMNT